MKGFFQVRSSMVLASLVLAFVAQYLFTGEMFTRTVDTNYRIWLPVYNIACALLALSAGLAAATFVRERQKQPPGKLSSAGNPARTTRLARTLTGPAMCYAATLAIYWTVGENWLVHLLWIAGAASLLAPLWLAKEDVLPEPPSIRLLGRPLAWAEWLAVAAVTMIGFDLRYWRLTELPVNFHDDVSLMGWFSLDMMRHGDTRWFGMSPSYHVLSTHQIQIWSMRLFGESQYGLVMVSVLAGTLTLPLMYLLGRETFGRRAGFVAMAMLAGSYTHIHFSRIMFGPVATFLLTGAFYAFFRGWRTQRDLPFAASGLCLGAALLTYDSSRVGPVIIAALFLTSRFWKPESTDLSVTMRHWTLLSAGALLAFGPMLAFIIQDFYAYVGRGHAVMLWIPVTWSHSLEKYGVTSAGQLLFEQLRHTFLCLHLYGDESPHFALLRPMVDAITAALFTLGAGFCLWRWRDPRCFALLAWIGLTFILGGVMTSDPPYWPHLNIALPPIMLVAGMAADRLGRTVFPTAANSRGTLAYSLILVVVLGWSGAHSWSVYRQFAAHTDDPRVQSARYIREFPNGTNVYLVDPVIGWDMYSFKFLDRRVRGITLRPQDMTTRSNLPAANGPTVFVVYRKPELAQAICDAYQGERAVPHHDVHGDLAFTSIELNVRPTPTPHGTRMPQNPWNLPGWWVVAIGALTMMTLSLRRLHRDTMAGG